MCAYIVLTCQQSGMCTVYMFAPWHHWREWKKTRIVQFFETKNLCWSSKWPNSQSNCSHSIRGCLLELAVIHDYPEEGAFNSRKCQTCKDCCHNSSELSSDNSEIGSRSRQYQPEAFGRSGPVWFFFGPWSNGSCPRFFGTKKSFFSPLFCSACIPSTVQPHFFCKFQSCVHT